MKELTERTFCMPEYSAPEVMRMAKILPMPKPQPARRRREDRKIA